jgi:protocatechuate 3,4-dioxygenase beta subunit
MAVSLSFLSRRVTGITYSHITHKQTAKCIYTRLTTQIYFQQDNVSEAMKKLSIADIAKQSSSTTMEPTVPQSSLDNSEGTSSSSISMQDRSVLQ